MDLYNYKLLDNSGNIIQGVSFAQSPEDFGGTIIRFKKCRSQINKPKETFTIPFLSNLLQLLKNRIELIAALSITQQLFKDLKSKAVIGFIIDKIERGSRFADSLACFENYFDKFSIKIIEIAEKSNRLITALEKIVQYLNANLSIKKKIKISIVYPSVLFIFFLIVIIFWLIFIIPKFAELFSSLNINIVGLTKFVITVSLFCTSNKILFFIFLTIFFVVMFFLLKSKKVLSYLPVYKTIQYELTVMNFCGCMAIMLQEKFDLLDGIDCLSDINISSGINRIASFIRNGNTLSASIKKSRVFKDYEVSIIEAGEKSGDFVIAFQSVYELLNTQLNHRITKFLNLIQPVGITFIGLLLIFIIISVISPLYSSLSKIG